jgi:hypothetical protein
MKVAPGAMRCVNHDTMHQTLPPSEMARLTRKARNYTRFGTMKTVIFPHCRQVNFIEMNPLPGSNVVF